VDQSVVFHAEFVELPACGKLLRVFGFIEICAFYAVIVFVKIPACAGACLLEAPVV
jgi:hypothetical protein